MSDPVERDRTDGPLAQMCAWCGELMYLQVQEGDSYRVCRVQGVLILERNGVRLPLSHGICGRCALDVK